MAEVSIVSKTSIVTLGLLLVSTLVVFMPLSGVSAQTQYVTASPGYINLGLSTTISVTANSSGSYTVVVQKPNGLESQMPATLSAGQVKNLTYGNSTTGFGTLVDQVGTYNVFLEQSNAVVSSTSFYATNKLDVAMDMVTGGTCAYVPGVDRGEKIFPRFSISFASNGAPVTNNDAGISVTFSLPGGSNSTASWDSGAKLFVGRVLPNWNYTSVGAWNPIATVHDAAGNVGIFTYSGSPYIISPASLSTSIDLVNGATNNTITSIYSNENVTIYATIQYPGNAEPVSGFIAPLDSNTRGGSVNAVIGYGAYNSTSDAFVGTNAGTLSKLSLTYTGKNGVWTGSFTTGSLPALNSSQTFQVVINSQDNASPPNTGFAALSIAPTSGQVISSTTSSTTQVTSSASSNTASITSIPLWAYAGTTIALIVGVIVGFLARRPK